MSARVFGFPLVDVLGLLSVILAVWFALPQLLRLRRTGTAAGLSADSLANSLVSLIGWTVYGLAHGNMWVILASVAGIPATVVTLVLAFRAGARPSIQLPALWASVLLVTAVIDLVFGLSLIDIVLGCSILWFVVPAAVTAWKSADVSGLSPQTWLVLALEASVFGIYGLVGHVLADQVYAVTSLIGAAAVLSRIYCGVLLRIPARSAQEVESTR